MSSERIRHTNVQATGKQLDKKMIRQNQLLKKCLTNMAKASVNTKNTRKILYLSFDYF